MSGEDYVQLAPNSTGSKVRNISLDVPQADGSIATVKMQVVNVRDENGDPLVAQDAFQRGIYAEVRALRIMYGRATGQLISLPALPGTPDNG